MNAHSFAYNVGANVTFSMSLIQQGERSYFELAALPQRKGGEWAIIANYPNNYWGHSHASREFAALVKYADTRDSVHYTGSARM